MEKYFAFMNHPLTGKEVVTSGWSREAISEWITFHEIKGYVLTKRNYLNEQD